jgi:hypothetical protein
MRPEEGGILRHVSPLRTGRLNRLQVLPGESAFAPGSSPPVRFY